MATVLCDYCKQLWEVPDDPKDRTLHGCPQQSGLISAVIGITAHFMPIKQVGKVSKVSKSFHEGAESNLAPAKEMWQLNGALSQKLGQTRTNFINEGVAARLLKAVCPNYQAWDALSQEKKDALKSKFQRPDLTPDYYFIIGEVERVGDAFSVNCSQGPKDEELRKKFDVLNAAQSAIKTSFPAKLTEKWNKYGENSVAVANLNGFPDEATLPTNTILQWIGELCVKEFAAHSKKGNLFFLVRDPLIKHILLA
jgi:hypothetical protein